HFALGFTFFYIHDISGVTRNLNLKYVYSSSEDEGLIILLTFGLMQELEWHTRTLGMLQNENMLPFAAFTGVNHHGDTGIAAAVAKVFPQHKWVPAYLTSFFFAELSLTHRFKSFSEYFYNSSPDSTCLVFSGKHYFGIFL
ncbi:hypothetical protein ACJX0J_037518, partial [Zea mays]